jgi:hypothetical protein
MESYAELLARATYNDRLYLHACAQKCLWFKKNYRREPDHIASQLSRVNIDSNHFRMGPDILEPYICQMFQMFQMYVAKVDLDVTYVAMAIHVCRKCMFRLFQTYVVSVFIWMLYILHWLYTYFASVCFSCFQTYVASVFIWMFYVLHWLYTYVASVCFKYFSCFKRML